VNAEESYNFAALISCSLKAEALVLSAFTELQTVFRAVLGDVTLIIRFWFRCTQR
jgi:hypothetical protein